MWSHHPNTKKVKVNNMEVIINASVRPYNVTINHKGKMVTVTLAPGASRVKKEYIKTLQETRLFSTLEDDGILIVGTKKAPKNTTDAGEIVAPTTNKESSKKKANKKATSTTGENGVGDLEDL